MAYHWATMSSLLFTTLPSNDLGLLTRALPVASELAARGHAVTFCSPGPAPGLLVAEAGFGNLLPHHPLYAVLAGEADPAGLLRTLRIGRRDFGGLQGFSFESLNHPGSLPGMNRHKVRMQKPCLSPPLKTCS